MTDVSKMAPTKRAYTFCMSTRELMGQLDAPVSFDGTYPLPVNATFAEPGEDPGPQKKARLLPDGSAWEIVDDFRRGGLWDTATAMHIPNTLALGEHPPKGMTAVPPPLYGPSDRKAAFWNASTNAWDSVSDYRGATYWVADGPVTGTTITVLGDVPPPGALFQAPLQPSLEEQQAAALAAQIEQANTGT